MNQIVQSWVGRCSTFGGPEDQGVRSAEGVALYREADGKDGCGLWLERVPYGTTGLARRLNPLAFYVACRWDYNRFSASTLRASWVRVIHGVRVAFARPVDWGPLASTGRVVDLSPGLATYLNASTDDVVQVDLLGTR